MSRSAHARVPRHSRVQVSHPPLDGQTTKQLQMRVAVLASHEGTTLQAVVDACAAGVVPCQVVAVISNNQESGAIQRAQAAGICLLPVESKSSGPWG